MIDWQRFAADLRAVTPDRPAAERATGISHGRMHGALTGRPLGTDIYLALCSYASLDPLRYWSVG